jgi:hypothetical protein
MREFANVDSTLPSSFDRLVWDVFGDLLATASGFGGGGPVRLAGTNRGWRRRRLFLLPFGQ